MDDLMPTPGSYVVAVSGGVDSMVLLHMLKERAIAGRDLKLIVAHLDHGIREDSAEDRRFVQELARQYGLPFVYHEVRLGAGASEADARSARYGFLRKVQRSSGTQAIITAHHQDDVLETAIINILRGSGRKGLTALSSRPDMIRPLLGVPKTKLLAYAKDQGLTWREDSTNQNQAYLRNYVRHQMLSRLDDLSRAALWQHINNLQKTNQELDGLLASQLQLQDEPGTLGRRWFNHLPHAVAREVMAAWLRAHDLRDFDRKSLERLVIAAKVAHSGRIFPVRAGLSLVVNANNLALSVPER